MKEEKKNDYISVATTQRIPFYLTYLKKKYKEGVKSISSTVIARDLDLNDVQVRKDLHAVSNNGGKPKVGYEIIQLISDLEMFLGYNFIDHAILVGCGSLGRALLSYSGFDDYGLKIIAGFDSYTPIIGTKIAGKTVYSIQRLQEIVVEENVRIGIIAVPQNSAQEVCDQMVACGIRAIWNFAPMKLQVPEGVIVQNENMAVSLAVLSRHLLEQIYQKK